MNLYIPDPKRFIASPYTAYTYTEQEDDLSNSDRSFLATTARAALASEYRFRMAAMLVKSGRVLSVSTNYNRRSSTTPPNRWSTHAEIRAIRSASDTKDATLYVARLSKSGDVALAKPCAWCMEHIITAKISRVVYTIDNNTCASFYSHMVSWT